MFTFIKYISPAWYYYLETKCPKQYWINPDQLSAQDKTIIDKFDDFSTDEIVVLDAAYQAWVKGIITTNGTRGINTANIRPSIRDEYFFVRRYYNSIWAYFILIVRLLEFYNPITEFRSFFSSLKVKRIDVYAKTKDWRPLLQAYNSNLLKAKPKVSIIIPTLNRYKYLKDVLYDLEKQDYKNFEVLVIDQSEPFDEEFYKGFDLDLKLWFQEEKALWLARNFAIEKSSGEYILLFDDDSRVDSDWIGAHLLCLDFFKADISSGVSFSKVGANIPETYSYYKWGDQIDTGNVMLKKEIFRKIGLFDRQFEKQRQGDGEFGLRAYLAGYKNISNPDASRIHLKVSEGGLRQMGSWDGWRPKNFFAPRPVPSVLYLTRKYFGDRAAIYQIVHSVLPSIIPYRFKRSRAMMLLGSLLGFILLPLICISVIRSWRQASKKLSEGAKISSLE